MDCIVHRVAKSWTWLRDFHSVTQATLVSYLVFAGSLPCIHVTKLQCDFSAVNLSHNQFNS